MHRVTFVYYFRDLSGENFGIEIQLIMENMIEMNMPSFRRNGWIPTIDFESDLVDELQQERLRQSRIIANQLDVIGKLRHALEMMMSDRSSRVSNASTSIGERHIRHERRDSCSQTACDEADSELVKKALSYLYVENRELLHRHKESEQALRSEREKSKRILKVCSRMSSGKGCSISSPALAKWVSLGLEELEVPHRNRTETFDDSVLPRFWGCEEGSSTTRSRSAFSEGNSPRAGFDLDMVYGINVGTPSVLPDYALPMTPRAGGGDLVTLLEGVYWTGESVGWIRKDPSGYLESSLYEGGHVHVTDFTSNEITVYSKSGEERIVGYYSLDNLSINWVEEGGLKHHWKRMKESPDILVGEWWTGFSLLKLAAIDDCTRMEGVWGQRHIQVSLCSFMEKGKAEIRLEYIDGMGGCMQGSLEPRYSPPDPQVPSIIRWNNGMVWEQVSRRG